MILAGRNQDKMAVGGELFFFHVFGFAEQSCLI